MALADIITKIESDAAEEAARIVGAAEERAAAIRDAAERQAAEYREATLAAAERDARREASRLVVTARLEARDVGLAERHKLVREALETAAERLAALPDDQYLAFVAARVARAVRGGDTLRLGSADAARLAGLADAVATLAPGVSVAASPEPAPFERGVLIEGSRVRADLSLAAIVEESSDELELVIASTLFTEGA